MSFVSVNSSYDKLYLGRGCFQKLARQSLPQETVYVLGKHLENLLFLEAPNKLFSSAFIL